MAPDALWAARETAGPSSWSREHVLQTDACHLKGEMIWWLKQGTREPYKVLLSLG